MHARPTTSWLRIFILNPGGGTQTNQLETLGFPLGTPLLDCPYVGMAVWGHKSHGEQIL